jgi:hypothetical protein
MAGLMPSTVYYVRSYAINASGTAYGQERSFQTTAQASGPVTYPSVLTQTVTKTDSNHIMGGIVVDGGNSPITAQGICWNRTGTPTMADSVVNFTPVGVGQYSLSVNLPLGCNETFYVRAFALSGAGIAYGQQVFTTNGFAPKLGASHLTQIGATTATFQTTILASGGCAVTERGVCWSTSPGPTNDISLFRTVCGSDTGNYSCQLTNLLPQTVYYARAYMTNVTGTFYGVEQSFTTDTTSALYIGKPYAGGIIFELDSTGQHGLVCAPFWQGSYPWGCNGTDIPNTSPGVGTGMFNTNFITFLCNERPTAASVCADLVLNGYSDWYLPSIDELEMAFHRLEILGLGGLGGTLSWSSSQIDSARARCLGFSGWGKDGSLPVRAIRAF